MTTGDSISKDNRLAVHTEEFWSEDALLDEQKRQFDVCHGCRLCFNFCPAFPDLFDLTDKVEEEKGLSLTRELLRPVEAQCYQCQLCYLRCPYTDPHEYKLDVPALFLRAKFVNARKEGIPLSDRVLADTDTLGRLGSKASGLVNRASKSTPLRVIGEKVGGIHRAAWLPMFASPTFSQWFADNRDRLATKVVEPTRKAALFYTCYLNYWGQPAAVACAEVFSHNGIEVVVPAQQCCGMPFLDIGAAKGVQRKIDANLPQLLKAIDEGYDIVVPGPSCAMMLKRDWPMIHQSAETERIAEHTYEVSEYLWLHKLAGSLNTDFQHSLGKVAYHAPCHLRMLFVGNKGADLIGLIPGTEVTAVERCSHHDGTWGIKTDSHDISMKYGKRLFDDLTDAEADLFVSDCPLASTQIGQGTGRQPIHTMQVLKQAYGI